MVTCISAGCVLGIVIVGLLLMTGAISLERAGAALGRGLVLVLLLLYAICVLAALVASALPLLKTALTWIAILTVLIIGLLLLAALIRGLTRHLPTKYSDQRGEE